MSARRIAIWAGSIIVALALLAGIAVLGLNTGPGRAFAVRQLNAYSLESGLNFRAQRIDGSLYGQMTLVGFEVRDAQGTFVTAPRIDVDWRPFAYLSNIVDVRAASAPEIRVLRNPVLKPVKSDPNAPLLPDLDIRVGSLKIARLIVEAPVSGQRHIVRVDAGIDIADRRARITANADAIRAAGVAGGDRLMLKLDAVPDANRLVIDADLAAPSGGLIDSYAKLGRPLTARIGGRGDWKNWRGQLDARMAGQPLALLDLTARNGTFTAKGPTQPGMILTGSIQRLFAPRLDIDATATVSERRADTRFSLNSDALTVNGKGLVDLGRSRLGGFAVDGLLKKPGAIADNLSGRDVRVVATLDGPFATPVIDYKVTAGTIAFGATGIEGLAASGRARIDTDRILVPIAATARRVTGLNAAAGGLVTNLSLNGDLAYSGGRILSDNLRLRSDRIDATAIVVADPAHGRYTGALKGRVNDYLVAGLGRINLTTDAKLVTGPKGGFGISGVVRVVTRQITNASVAQQLGGQAVTTARFGFDENGIARVGALRLVSPGLRILDGSGSYRPDGRIAFSARAVSRQYGPLTLLASGTIARPVVRLRAAHPNVGVQLSNVDALLTGTGAGYRVVAKGGSPYGPFSADVLIATRRGPLTVDIARARFAGVDFRGRIVQAPAGPFVGDLALAGSGLNGSIRLAAAGKYQRADVDVRANAARIPGDAPITIGRGVVRASVILFPNAPAVDGDFVLANVVQGATSLSNARGRIHYRDQRGTAAIVADGRSGAPFQIAAQAAFDPNRVLANARGTANGIAFRLASPAVVTRAAGTWTVQPVTIVVPQGQVRVSGSYGRALQLVAQLENLDLSLVQAFAPGLGLGGKASGTIDYRSGDVVPIANARLTIAGFTRTAAYTRSAPVDVAVLASLASSGADVRAVVRRGPAVIGRVQARLAPLGSGTLLQRLTSAPLAGGIRYNGPAEVLWALTGIANQQLSGPIVVAADFGGRVNQPSLNGLIRADALRYENQAYGTVITNLAIGGRFTQSQLQLASLNGRAGRGTISGRGTIGFDAASGFPINLALKFENAQLARSDALGATVSGDLAIVNGAKGGSITGTLTIPEARYEIIRQGSADIVELTGVRRKNAVVPAQAEKPAPTFGSNFALDVRIRAENQIFVSGMGLEAEWSTDIRVTGNAANPRVVGKLEVVRGTYSFAGKRFDLDDNGRITFDGGALTNPQIALVARTSVQGVSATIDISGRAQNPQITFTSTPALPQDEVLSRLLFGSSVTSLSPVQAIQLAAALNSLRGSGGGLNPLGKLRSASGVSRLRILGADQATGRGTALAAGQYISKNIYVEVITDARGFTATQLEIGLSRVLSILSQTSSFGGTSATIRYSRDY